MAWRVAKISGQTAGTWRVANIGGSISTAPTSWQVAKISGAISGSWQVANIGGNISVTSVAPTLGTFSGTPLVDPAFPVVVVGSLTNNVQPDYWTFHLGSTGAGSSDLDNRILSVAGNTAVISPPGSIGGSTITLTMTATSGSSTSTAVSVNMQVRKGTVFQVVGGNTYKATAPFTIPPNAIQRITPSTGTPPVPNLSILTAPAITGTAQVGQALTVSNGTWNVTPDSYTYAWFRDGVAISGATAKTYTLVTADNGHTVLAAVTATKANYTSSTANSLGVSVTASTQVLTNTAVPVISGTAAVGQTLTATTGSWSAAPDSYAYAWTSNSVPISGATTSTYMVSSADAGNPVSVVVTASKANYTSASATAAALNIPSPATGGSNGFRTAFLTGKKASGAISKSNQTNFTISDLAFQNIGNDVSSIRLSNCSNFIIEQCDFDTVCQAITLTNCYNYQIRYNRARNITGPHTRNGTNRGNFIQAVQCTGVSQYIGYNQVRDGDTEDWFSIYQSNGTSASPIILEYNRIENETYTSTSGSGMLLGDGNGSWQVARNNFMLNPGQVGIGIGGGNNITADSNQIWGDQTAYSNIGMYVANYSSATSMSNIVITNNKVFFKNKSGTVNGFYNDGFATNVTNSGNSFSSQGTLVRADLVVNLVGGK